MFIIKEINLSNILVENIYIYKNIYIYISLNPLLPVVTCRRTVERNILIIIILVIPNIQFNYLESKNPNYLFLIFFMKNFKTIYFISWEEARLQFLIYFLISYDYYWNIETQSRKSNVSHTKTLQKSRCNDRYKYSSIWILVYPRLAIDEQ